MSARPPLPPPLADALLRRVLPPGTSGLTILGDLREEFRERAGGRGARLWYWRQALGFAVRASRPRPAPIPVSRGGFMRDLLGDLKQAWRGARHAPGQALVVIATLAVAIGAATVAFTFTDLLVLRGLPIAEPDRTMFVFSTNEQQGVFRSGVSLEDYLDYREASRTLPDLAAWTLDRATLIHDGVASGVGIQRATANLGAAWGLRLVQGRFFLPGEDRPGAPRVALLTHQYWQRAFGGGPVVGETVRLDGEVHEIVGVLDPATELGNFSTIAVWVPLTLERGAPRDDRRVALTGRLAPDATQEMAVTEIEGQARRLAASYPDTHAGWDVAVLSGSRALTGPNVFLVLALFTLAVAFIMLIACANVANLLLARATARQREFALRAALGARRSRMFRQMLVEGLLLAAVAGIGGLAVAEAGLRVIRSVDAEPAFQQVVIDGHEFLFVAGLCLLAPLLFSVAPAVAASRGDLRALLNAGGARTGGDGADRGRRVLVAGQLALAVTLTMAAGLAVRTGINSSLAPNGFDPAPLLAFEMVVDDAAPADEAARRALVGRLAERLRETPGIAQVGAVDLLPISPREPTVSLVVDGLVTGPDEAAPWAYVRAATPGTLEAFGVPLLAGRAISRADVEGDRAVALVSASAAERYFGGVDAALGRRVTPQTGASPARQIVGVVGDVRSLNVEQGWPPRVWVPLAQPSRMAFVVSSAAGDPAALAPAVRDVMRAELPAVPVEMLEPYTTSLARWDASNRILIGLFAAFSTMALVLAAVGLFAVISYSVSRRQAEFGTRVALGARAADVVRLVLRHAFGLLAVGLGLGLVGGLLLGEGMRAALYGVTPFDAANVAMVVGLLVAVTLAASVLPALRAARVDVVQMLRAE